MGCGKWGALAEKLAFKDKDTTLNTDARRASRPKKGFLWFLFYLQTIVYTPTEALDAGMGKPGKGWRVL